MKAVTVRQPWATLIAIGAKRYETRSWQTHHRGELAIHAGMACDVADDADFRVIEKALRRHGFGDLPSLPYGRVIGGALLVKVHRAEAIRSRLSREQRAFGDFSDGRFAWELAKVRRFGVPVPARGRLGLWNWQDDEAIGDD